MPHWSSKWRGRLNRVDVDSVLATECGDFTVTVKKSAIPHLKAWYGLFPARSVGPGQTVSLYYGTLVYSDLVNEKQK